MNEHNARQMRSGLSGVLWFARGWAFGGGKTSSQGGHTLFHHGSPLPYLPYCYLHFSSSFFPVTFFSLKIFTLERDDISYMDTSLMSHQEKRTIKLNLTKAQNSIIQRLSRPPGLVPKTSALFGLALSSAKKKNRK